MTDDLIVMPWFNPEYYGYHWSGLRQALPDAKVVWSTRAFPSLASDFHRPRDTFAFEYRGMRYSLSVNDMPEVNEALLDWSDVHGKVNLTQADSVRDGVVPLGPYFGFRAFGLRDQAALAASFTRYRPPPAWRHRQLLATLRRQSRRAPWSAYQPDDTDHGGRPFYLGTYWHRHPTDNDERVAFLRSLDRMLGRGGWDGGLVPQGDRPLPADLIGLAAAPMTHQAYVDRVRAAPFVFNHPAVHQCLGWKLGEFFALGKAMITTRVEHALPAPLQHGEHWHVVDDDPASLDAAVALLLADEDYRRHLGRSARRYFELHLAPQASVDRILSRAA